MTLPLTVLLTALLLKHVVCHSITLGSRNHVNICEAAIDIMRNNSWDRDVTFYDILNIFPIQFPDYRVTILLPALACHQEKTVAGPEYVFETRANGTQLTLNCERKTIYLIYDVESRHYGLVSQPINVIRHFQGKSRKFCHRCVTAFSPYKDCNCGKVFNPRKRKFTAPNKCSFCHRATCDGNGCAKNCQFCGARYTRGYDQSLGQGHRCIVYSEPRTETFWKKGDEEKEKNPDYKVWVYDIECAAKTSLEKTIDFETFNDAFVVDHENSKAVIFERQAVTHCPNLLIFRNVFDDDSSEKILYGENCIKEFIDFLLTTNYGRNIAIAHNGSGYDTRIIHEAALKHEQKLKINVVRRGLKFMQLEIEKVKFRDSYLFLPSSLAALAKSFNLSLKKGIFPHMFNTPENQNYVGRIPAKKYFDLRFYAKSEKDLAEFHEWYDERIKTSWDFKKELISYCQDDVRILAMIVKIFNDICFDKFKQSPWTCITAPAYVHKVVLNKISEKLALPRDNEDRARIIKQTREKWSVLTPSEYWFVRNCLRGGRTDARCLHYKLTPEEKAKGLKIKYVDVVSMYPAVQVKYPYPIGEPKVHIYDKKFFPCYRHQNPPKGNAFKNCSCSFEARHKERLNMDIVLHDTQPTLEELRSMFGFICVSCIPNNHLFHPPLVAWDDDQNKCTASLEPIVEGYFTTEEFLLALDLGYTVTKVHRVDQYEKAEGLWNEFVKDLYIEKLAHSGPAPGPDERRRIVEAYERAFNMGHAVEESFDRWKYDGALRTVFKTLLNCGWGKHCQRPNMDQHVVINSDETGDNKFYDDIQSGLFRATGVELLDNGYQIYTLKNTENSIVNTHQTYIPAGCYVPAYGRITLFKELNKLGDRVLYHDTDSVIYIYDPEQYNVPENDLWGDWDEEKISKKGIEEFVSLGPKSYGVRTESETIIKLKGLSIKHAHRNLVNFETLCDFILKHTHGVYPEIEIPQFQFKYKIGKGLTTMNFLKKLKFSPEILKGDLKGFKIYPKGYCEKCFKDMPCL